MKILELFLLYLAAAYADYSIDALKDRITSLPGAELLDIHFMQFSGYLKIGQNGRKNMVLRYLLLTLLNECN